MNIFISSYPPLGQVSVVEKVTTFFTVAIEVKPDHISNLCQASLWHSDGEDQNWLEECMSPWPNSSDPPIVLHASKKQQIYGQIFFTAMLDIKLIKRFTIKFRNSPDQPWNWSRDLSGISDGIIILKHISLEKDTSDDLRYYIPGLSPLLQSNKSAGKYIGMVLWSIEASIEAARKDKSRWKTINFGMPWGKMGFLRYLKSR